MPVRLNITMDPELYKRLKRELPKRRISSFIEEAVRSRLAPDEKILDAAYREARKETWRQALATEWWATESEDWPE